MAETTQSPRHGSAKLKVIEEVVRLESGGRRPAGGCQILALVCANCRRKGQPDVPAD
jgi:hypothetical protein